MEFKKFLAKAGREVLDPHVRLVLDNNTTHGTAAVKNWLLSHPRLPLLFTSTGSSWWNAGPGSCGAAELTNERIRRGGHTSVRVLGRDIRAWIRTWNTDPRPYMWVSP
ncbi:hypothetical protein AB0N87_42315 [Streptomyces sp. NPDC093228]|uniref:hypothetical protein n=1 Tax=Streptomyces sp. NPDC093228 TaxID=3155070 RepID=UPI00343320FF